jgi:signal transduction histidine kinase
VEWERILVNLLLNSAQAMEEGGQVELSAKPEGGRVVVRVADNGPGIAPSILPRIFQPHFSTKRAHRGMGLHIVRTLVQANGGAVTARNREAGGAEFVIECGPAEPVS